MAARLVNHRRENRKEGHALVLPAPQALSPERGDPAAEAASSFPGASAELPSPEAGRGGSCRPFAIQDRKDLAREGWAPRDLSKSKSGAQGHSIASSQEKWRDMEGLSIPLFGASWPF